MENHPSLNFHDSDGEVISLYFGHDMETGDASMLVFKADAHITSIPRNVLIIALQDGWGNLESGWWVNPSKN